MTVQAEYLSLFRAARAFALSALDVRFDRALKNEDAAAMASERALRRALLDFPATVVSKDRAELIAQWPASLPPLPEWFTNPESVEPLGEPCVIEVKIQ